MRDKHEQTLTLTLPEKKDSGQLIEDSFEVPEFTAETQLAIDGAEHEIARLSLEQVGPEMQELERNLERSAEAQKRAEEDFCQQQKGFQKRLEEQQKKMKEREQLIRDRQKAMRDRQEKLRHESTRNWAEI